MLYYRRTLPHWHPNLPVCKVNPEVSGGEGFARWDRELDAATTGPVWLGDARIAGVVVDTITQAGERWMCELGAFVLMSNHAHLFVRPRVAVASLTQWITGVSAKRAEWSRIVPHIEDNPVNARLAESPGDWLYSSAHMFTGTS